MGFVSLFLEISGLRFPAYSSLLKWHVVDSHDFRF